MSWFNEKHTHRWKCVRVYNFIDTSWDQEVPSYNATYSCIDCGEIKNEAVYAGGNITVEQLNSAIDFKENECD